MWTAKQAVNSQQLPVISDPETVQKKMDATAVRSPAFWPRPR